MVVEIVIFKKVSRNVSSEKRAILNKKIIKKLTETKMPNSGSNNNNKTGNDLPTRIAGIN